MSVSHNQLLLLCGSGRFSRPMFRCGHTYYTDGAIVARIPGDHGVGTSIELEDRAIWHADVEAWLPFGKYAPIVAGDGHTVGFVYGVPVQHKYLSLMAMLPATEVGIGSITAINNQQPLPTRFVRFRFDGGEGAVMPLGKPNE